jgi:hypothetical protein
MVTTRGAWRSRAAGRPRDACLKCGAARSRATRGEVAVRWEVTTLTVRSRSGGVRHKGNKVRVTVEEAAVLWALSRL